MHNSILCINSLCTLPQDLRNIEKSSDFLLKKTKKSKSYHLSTFKTDFLSAQQRCLENGMKLASVMSEEENEKYINSTKLPGQFLNLKIRTS